MRRLTLAILLLSLALPLAAQAEQIPPTATLTVTDKAAVAAWAKSTYGQKLGTPDDVTGDTALLLSLNETERQGASLIRQHCNACHGADAFGARSYGPRLSKDTLEGREDALSTQIMDGSENMPAFRYALQPTQIKTIIDYLKKVGAYCTDCKAGDVRRAGAMMK